MTNQVKETIGERLVESQTSGCLRMDTSEPTSSSKPSTTFSIGDSQLDFGKARTAHTNSGDIKKMNMNATSQPIPAFLLNGGLGSRGSVILRAALVERNNKKDEPVSQSNSNNFVPARDPVLYERNLDPEQEFTAHLLAQYEAEQDRKYKRGRQAALEESRRIQRANSRKKSPKNKVIFTDPVVTNHFEYEPTFVPDPVEQDIPLSIIRTLQSQLSRPKPACEALRPHDAMPPSSPEPKENKTKIEENDPESDEDEIFYFASSSFECFDE